MNTMRKTVLIINELKQKMKTVKLALELNKVVHNECKDVPHDIGLKLLEVVKKHVGEKLNLPLVIKSVCGNCDNTHANQAKPQYCAYCGEYLYTYLLICELNEQLKQKRNERISEPAKPELFTDENYHKSCQI